MYKKIFLSLLILIPSAAYASELPFTDVSSRDPYYSDIKHMYDAGVIGDTVDHLFRPDGLLPRDQFVGMVVGVSCRKCLYPTPEDIIRYTRDPFVDILKKNRYFYCVSYAKEKEIVRGYTLDRSGKAQCQDKQNFSEVPFCPANNITRIEAAAVLLRQSGLWNESRNNASYEKSIAFKDVDDYWYGYAQKAVESGLVTLSADNKIAPNVYITRKEFVTMASKIFGINMCSIKNTRGSSAGFASGIKIFDKEKKNCDGSEKPAGFADNTQDTYDFGWYATGSLTAPLTYAWTFTNNATGENKTATGTCLDDFRLESAGSWTIRLIVTDMDGKSSTAYQQISVKNGGLSVQISDARNLIGTSDTQLRGVVGVPVSFLSTVTGGDGHYTYRWEFSDGGTASDKDASHTFAKEGVYSVSFTVHDDSGNVAYAQSTVIISRNTDRDNDGIPDYDGEGKILDLCPNVSWTASGQWCPSVNEYDPDSAGNTGVVTTYTGGPVNNLCLSDKIKHSGMIEWGVQCTSCPCEYSSEFLAKIRSCDIIFPSIASPDKKTLYSRGKIFPVP